MFEENQYFSILSLQPTHCHSLKFSLTALVVSITRSLPFILIPSLHSLIPIFLYYQSLWLLYSSPIPYIIQQWQISAAFHNPRMSFQIKLNAPHADMMFFIMPQNRLINKQIIIGTLRCLSSSFWFSW